MTQLSNLAHGRLETSAARHPAAAGDEVRRLQPARGLVTVKGEGMTETQLHDLAQFQIRNQIAVVNGAEIPAVFGGKYRQAEVYVDPYKLFSRQLSVMDVVDAVNDSNLILPAGDVKIGPTDFYVYSNSLVQNVSDLNNVPIKTVGSSWVSVGDVGEAKDASQLQYNIVRIDGQKSAYIPIMKSGGDSNTIQVVNDVDTLRKNLFGLPKQLVTDLVFDQSVFVKEAINTVLHEGATGLVLIGLIILVFLGSGRATFAVLLSIPISTMATFVVLSLLGSNINTMILARTRPGVLARHRQLRHFAGKHLPPSRNGLRHRGSGRAGRRGGQHGRAGRDSGRCGRLLSGHSAFGVSKFLFRPWRCLSCWPCWLRSWWR